MLRPSDRGYDIRLYTKMDLDIWKYADVRDWFNSGYKEPDTPPDNKIMVGKSYMIKL